MVSVLNYLMKLKINVIGLREPSKQLAEQSAAIVCLEYLKIDYKRNIASFI